jgi:hypothetical protein
MWWEERRWRGLWRSRLGTRVTFRMLNRYPNRDEQERET